MSNITLTIPNDDHIALRAFGKALEEMALAHGAEPRKTTIDTSESTAAPQMVSEPEVDTTAQQVESLAAPMGDDEEQAPSTTDSTGTPWDERIHTKSRSKHDAVRETGMYVGWKVTECADAKDFDWGSLNYEYYVKEAEKLVLPLTSASK